MRHIFQRLKWTGSKAFPCRLTPGGEYSYCSLEAFGGMEKRFHWHTTVPLSSKCLRCLEICERQNKSHAVPQCVMTDSLFFLVILLMAGLRHGFNPKSLSDWDSTNACEWWIIYYTDWRDILSLCLQHSEHTLRGTERTYDSSSHQYAVSAESHGPMNQMALSHIKICSLCVRVCVCARHRDFDSFRS